MELFNIVVIGCKFMCSVLFVMLTELFILVSELSASVHTLFASASGVFPSVSEVILSANYVFAPVSEVNTQVSEALTSFSDLFPLVSDTFVLVSDLFAPVSDVIALVSEKLTVVSEYFLIASDAQALLFVIPLALLFDRLLLDPFGKFHPIVIFGNIIAKGEKILNKGRYRLIKGGVFSVVLIITTFLLFTVIQIYIAKLSFPLLIAVNTFLLFLAIALQTLVKEVRDVFYVLNRQGIDAGRKQVARIVGRDTSNLDSKKIKIAALETLAENLSDGVIAPLFWFAVAGIPGVFTYKMINTLDSMIGYKSERYLFFGRVAARIDDGVNFIPARITALLMLMVYPSNRVFKSIVKYRRQHSSPNAGYPESAMSGILNCRFGGPNIYHNKIVDKPYIGTNDKEPLINDLNLAIRVCYGATIVFAIIILITNNL